MVSPSDLIDHFRTRPSQHCLVSAVDCHNCIVRLWNVSYRFMYKVPAGFRSCMMTLFTHTHLAHSQKIKSTATPWYQRH